MSLRGNLVTYLLASSAERARIISELAERNPGMAEILIDLEADDDLRMAFELDLMQSEP